MQIKDQATATEAALNLDKTVPDPAPIPGEPPAQRSQSTTSKLFPEFVAEDGLIVNRPVKPYVDADKALPPQAATPAPAPVTPAPNPPAPTAAGELDLSKLPEGTMVRVKVDGVEMTLSAKDALKNIQLERHLTMQGQKLAQERAALEAERAALRQPAPAAPKAPDAPPAPKAAPEDPRFVALERQIAELTAAVAPQQFQTGISRLDERAKAELGATDFREYVPKIQSFIDAEIAKPEVATNPGLMRQLDSQEFWYAKYQQMKLKDVLSGTKPAAPVLTPANIVPTIPNMAPPPGTTLVLDKNNQPVLVPIVEGSTGVPSRVSPDQNWQMRYQAAFDTAKKTGRTEDWQEVFRLKRETPAS